MPRKRPQHASGPTGPRPPQPIVRLDDPRIDIWEIPAEFFIKMLLPTLLAVEDEWTAIRLLRYFRKWVRGRPTLSAALGIQPQTRRPRGRPKGRSSLDRFQAAAIALAVDVGGVRRVTVLQWLGKAGAAGDPAPSRWLNRRLALGRTLVNALPPGSLQPFQSLRTDHPRVQRWFQQLLKGPASR